jgi:predicted TIM-barrel fold metal-dependent hydrolase
VMFGSNYPVDALFSPFDAIFDAFKDATTEDNRDDQRAMFLGNAQRIYRPVRLTESGPIPIDTNSDAVL